MKFGQKSQRPPLPLPVARPNANAVNGHATTSQPANPLERVPPHDGNMEKCVLGAMLMQSAAAQIAISELKPADFYVARHRKLFLALKSLFEQHQMIDEEFAASEFEAQGIIEEVGGKDFLGQLVIDTPSAANIETYCHAVRSRAADREAVQKGQELIKAGSEGRGAEALGISPDAARTELLRTSQLLAYDIDHDVNCLAGRRWANKGGSIVLTGPSGVGKSVLKEQFAVCAALGVPFFGIPFTRPLRILDIQAENDIGDIADGLRGVLRGLGYEQRAQQLEENLLFVTESTRTGEACARLISELADKHHPDCVQLDPYLSFLGGDINSQEVNSRFLRNFLTPIAQQHGFFFLIVHHHPKPKPPETRRGMVSSDHSYAGIGSSEITNWARATLNLSELQDGVYELRAAKRGKRAGLVDSEGVPTTAVYLRHSVTGICWERADAPDSAANEIAAARVDEICARLGTGSHKYAEIEEITKEVLGCKMRSQATKFMDQHIFKLLRKTPGTGLFSFNDTVAQRRRADITRKIFAALKNASDPAGALNELFHISNPEELITLDEARLRAGLDKLTGSEASQ